MGKGSIQTRGKEKVNEGGVKGKKKKKQRRSKMTHSEKSSSLKRNYKQPQTR